MANIDKISVKNTVFNIISPAVVSDYIEVIGGACTKPDGYEEDEVILAKQNDVQLLFKATQDIAFGANIVENTNCVRTTLEEVLKNAGGGGGASSADQVSYDNSESGLEAENVQEAVDELATKARTASSQIQTLTNEISARDFLGAKNFLESLVEPQTLTNGGNNLTISIDSDGYIDVNGTCATATPINIRPTVQSGDWKSHDSAWLKRLIGKNVILSGGASDITISLNIADSSNTTLVNVNSGYTGGESEAFTIPSGTELYWVYFYIRTGTYDHAKIKPMLRLASIQDSTYEPYAMTNQELTDRLYGVRKDSVDLSTYTSANPYIAPNDGYLYLYCTGSGNAVVAVIQDKNGLAMGFAEAKDGANRYAFDYIKKGMKIYIDSYTGTYTATFRLLE